MKLPEPQIVGLTTHGLMSLLLTWAVIVDYMSPWWLILSIPMFLTASAKELRN